MAVHQAQRLWRQVDLAKAELRVARERAGPVDEEFLRLKRVIASIEVVHEPALSLQERTALAVQRLRSAETRTGVSVKTIAPEGNAGDNRTVEGLTRPLARIPGAASMGFVIDGSYTTLGGLDEFLGGGRSSGAALVALTVRERRFQAGFRLYGRA